MTSPTLLGILRCLVRHKRSRRGQLLTRSDNLGDTIVMRAGSRSRHYADACLPVEQRRTCHVAILIGLVTETLPTSEYLKQFAKSTVG
jgi:hypothetical protein